MAEGETSCADGRLSSYCVGVLALQCTKSRFRCRSWVWRRTHGDPSLNPYHPCTEEEEEPEHARNTEMAASLAVERTPPPEGMGGNGTVNALRCTPRGQLSYDRDWPLQQQGINGVMEAATATEHEMKWNALNSSIEAFGYSSSYQEFESSLPNSVDLSLSERVTDSKKSKEESMREDMSHKPQEEEEINEEDLSLNSEISNLLYCYELKRTQEVQERCISKKKEIESHSLQVSRLCGEQLQDCLKTVSLHYLDQKQELRRQGDQHEKMAQEKQRRIHESHVKHIQAMTARIKDAERKTSEPKETKSNTLRLLQQQLDRVKGLQVNLRHMMEPVLLLLQRTNGVTGNKEVRQAIQHLKEVSNAISSLERKATDELISSEEFKSVEAKVAEAKNDLAVIQRVVDGAQKAKEAPNKIEHASDSNRKPVEKSPIRFPTPEHKAPVVSTKEHQKTKEKPKIPEPVKDTFDPISKPAEKSSPAHTSVQTTPGTLPTPIQRAAEPVPLMPEAPKRDSVKMGEIAALSVCSLDECADVSAFESYQHLQKKLDLWDKQSQAIIQDTRMKSFRFDCQKAVSTPVNSIAPTSREHLKDKLDRLIALLSGHSVDVMGRHFKASDHPLGVSFCAGLLAKKFVRQGEDSVSSKPESAFAIAKVMVALWAQFPAFGELLLANFYRKCPYLVPYYPPQSEGQSEEDYYRILGYRYSEAGVESQTEFLKRISGVMRLYASMLITPLPRWLSTSQHPLPLSKAWMWLGAAINMPVHPDITATAVFNMLDVTGNLMAKTYRHQLQKMLHILCKELFPKIQATPGIGGPVSRLEQFLQMCLKQSIVPLPPGVMPANFW